MNKVELRPSFAFDCDECGKENFVNGLVLELDEEESKELKDEFGIQPWEEGNWMELPKIVQCQYCKTKFKTMHYGNEN